MLAFTDAGLHKKQACRHDGAKKNDKGDALFQLVALIIAFSSNSVRQIRSIRMKLNEFLNAGDEIVNAAGELRRLSWMAEHFQLTLADKCASSMNDRWAVNNLYPLPYSLCLGDY